MHHKTRKYTCHQCGEKLTIDETLFRNKLGKVQRKGFYYFCHSEQVCKIQNANKEYVINRKIEDEYIQIVDQKREDDDIKAWEGFFGS